MTGLIRTQVLLDLFVAMNESEPGLEDDIRVKSAEFWLKLGRPDQALAEIQSLPRSAQNHPSVLKVHLAVVRAARELNESSGA